MKGNPDVIACLKELLRGETDEAALEQEDWFAEQGVSIEAAEITTRDGVATDRFLVDGEFDPSALANHLSPAPSLPFDRVRLPACALVSVGRRVRRGGPKSS